MEEGEKGVNKQFVDEFIVDFNSELAEEMGRLDQNHLKDVFEHKRGIFMFFHILNIFEAENEVQDAPEVLIDFIAYIFETESIRIPIVAIKHDKGNHIKLGWLSWIFKKIESSKSKNKQGGEAKGLLDGQEPSEGFHLVEKSDRGDLRVYLFKKKSFKYRSTNQAPKSKSIQILT